MGWNGLKAEGPVELNLDMISGDETPVADHQVSLWHGTEPGRFLSHGENKNSG